MRDVVRGLNLWYICIPWMKFTPSVDLVEDIKPFLGSQLGFKWTLNRV